MRSALMMLGALALCSGCGGNSFHGTVGDTTLSPREAIFLVSTPEFATQARELAFYNSSLVMEMADVSDFCDVRQTRGSSVDYFAVSFQNPGSTDSSLAGILPGTYPVGDAASELQAYAVYQSGTDLFGRSSAGTATLESFKAEPGGTMIGSFKVTLSGDDQGANPFHGTADVSGTFHATFCDLDQVVVGE